MLARDADVGVVFRRGPARWVRVIRWDTRQDAFDAGQWFHGRIYEERCDLSPDGELLVYFAYKGHRPVAFDDRDDDGPHLRTHRESWTAVSRPPWLTALALWPKGDTWMGGGVFTGRRALLLFHGYENRSHAEHRPTRLRVACIDGPVDVTRPVRPKLLETHGWERRSERAPGVTECWAKRVTGSTAALVRTTREGRRDGRTTWHLETAQGEVPLPDVRCADFDRPGRLVFTRGAGLFAAQLVGGAPVEQQLADFDAMRPERIESPPEARAWPSP